jgi:hypothetical protein
MPSAGFIKLRAAVLPSLSVGQASSTKKGKIVGFNQVTSMLTLEEYQMLYTLQDPDSEDPQDRIELPGFDGTMDTLPKEVLTSKKFFEAVAKFLETAPYLNDGKNTPLAPATGGQYLSNIKMYVFERYPDATLCDPNLVSSIAYFKALTTNMEISMARIAEQDNRLPSTKTPCIGKNRLGAVADFYHRQGTASAMMAILYLLLTFYSLGRAGEAALTKLIGAMIVTVMFL